MRFPAKITSCCIWVAIPVDLLIELFYIGLPVVRTDGRTDGRAVGRSVYGQVNSKFSRMGSAPRARAPLKFLTRIVKDIS